MANEENIKELKSESRHQTYYASVAYLQEPDAVQSLHDYHSQSDYKALLSEAAMYDQGDAINLDETYTSPTQHLYEDLLVEDDNYAVTYNNAAGGVYEVFRKVPEEEVRDTINRYGVSENISPDAKMVASAMVKEELNEQYGKFTSNAIVMPNEEVVYFDYDPRQDAIIAGGMTNAGLIPEHTIPYDHSESLDTNITNMVEELQSLPRYQAQEIEQDMEQDNDMEETTSYSRGWGR